MYLDFMPIVANFAGKLIYINSFFMHTWVICQKCHIFSWNFARIFSCKSDN